MTILRCSPYLLPLLSAFLLATYSVVEGQRISLHFNSQIIPNNSVLLLRDIGEDASSSLQCHTTRMDCCDSVSTGVEDGVGEWRLPNGSALRSLNNTPNEVDFYQKRKTRSVNLYRRNNATSPEGLFSCAIPNQSGTTVDIIYIGLYVEGNGAPVITSLAFSRLTQTLTCLSYGGPTTFTFWTRNGEVIPSNSPNYYDRSQSITDTEQGSYRNILHVLSPVLYEGNFTCTVSNSEGNSSIETSLPDAGDPPTQSGVYLFFRGESYGNNSLITLTDISETTPLICVTDDPSCCITDERVMSEALGEWLLPNFTIVYREGQKHGVYRNRGLRIVRMNRRDGVVVSGGLFQCLIHNSSGDLVRMYVGVYPENEGIPVVTGLNYNKETLTLTCNSTGGPASQVTLIKDGAVISAGNTEYVFSQRIIDLQNSSYINMIRGNRTANFLGVLTCIVENTRGRSNRSIEIDILPPPTPEGLTGIPSTMSVNLSWTIQSDSLRTIREYWLTYTYMGTCPETERVSTLVIANDRTSFTVTGLEGNTVYAFSLVAVNDKAVSNSTTTQVMTTSGTPGPPQSPSATATMTTLILTWERVECPQRNGNIVGYRVIINSFYGTRERRISGTGSETRTITEENIIPNTQYTIEIEAVGENSTRGQPTVVSLRTTIVQELVLQLNGERFHNNSIVDPSDIGEGENGLFCLTNKVNCCRDDGGLLRSRGEWYNPEGVDLPHKDGLGGAEGFYNNRGNSTVRLNRVGTGPSDFSGGLFRCEIPDTNDVFQNLYVGLYPTGSGVLTITEVTYDTTTTSLTCVTSGGPVSEVIWIYNLLEINIDGVNYQERLTLVPSTVEYRSVLGLRRENELVGIYRCVARNNRESTSQNFNLVEPVISVVSEGIHLGVLATIRCASGNGRQSATMAWLNSTGHVVTMATNTAQLELSMGHANFSINGTEFTCEVSNEVSKTYQIHVQDSGPPESFTVSPIVTGLNFTWAPPMNATPSFFGYQLSCSPVLEGIPTPAEVRTNPGVSVASVTGLEDGATYICYVRASVENYISEPAIVAITISETVPSSFPASFSVITIGATEVVFSWGPLPVLERNGVIIQYTVTCNSSFGSVSQSFEEDGTNATISGFWPNTTYSCDIFATNSAGDGPSRSGVSFTTKDDTALFQLRLRRVADCVTWVASQSQQKVADIFNEVIRNLNLLCQSCQVTPDQITNGGLLCFDESPQTVTFRATIHGTMEATTTELLAEMEQWVKSGDAAITVLSVVMIVDSSCDVSIMPTPSNQQCNVGAETKKLNLIPLIVGALGGVVVMVIIGCILVLMAMIFRKRRNRKSKSLKEANLDQDNVLTLQNTRQLQSVDDNDLSEDRNYAFIPPHLPSAHVQPSDQKEDMTAILNKSFRATSMGSLQYQPGTNDEVTYSEIDGGSEKANYDKSRRPSDYEKVFVKNIGFLSTEDAHALSTESLSQEEGKGKDAMKIPHVDNTYEMITNPVFQEAKISSSQEGKNSPNMMNTNSNEVLVPRSMSVSNNPLYTTSAMTKRERGFKNSGINETRSKSFPREEMNTQRVNLSHSHHVMYEIPTSDPHEETSTQRVNLSHPHHVMYEIPTSDPHEEPSTQGVNLSHPHHVMYEIPTSNPHEETSTQGVNENSSQPNNVMCDVSPSNDRTDLSSGEGLTRNL